MNSESVDYRIGRPELSRSIRFFCTRPIVEPWPASSASYPIDETLFWRQGNARAVTIPPSPRRGLFRLFAPHKSCRLRAALITQRSVVKRHGGQRKITANGQSPAIERAFDHAPSNLWTMAYRQRRQSSEPAILTKTLPFGKSSCCEFSSTVRPGWNPLSEVYPGSQPVDSNS